MKRDLGAHPIQLSGLLDGVSEGVVVLPEFQRNYDWNTSDVRSLLATVLMGWPSGSLLLMDGAPDFALRPLDGAPARSSQIEYVVLDGQQRLTSLFHALRGYGDQAWVLHLSRLPVRLSEVSVDDLEEAIEPIDRANWDIEYPLSRQASEGLIPLGTLTSPTEFFDWRDLAIEAVPEAEATKLRTRLTDAYKTLLSRVHDYAFPAVVLQPQLEVEAIARIFERINRTGLRLTTFDLMVARSYTPTWNLRDEWETALEIWPLLGDFMADGLPALQVVSLREETDIRQPAVLSTPPPVVRAQFVEACEGLATAFEWLVQTCGVRRSDWLPYGVLPVVLGALAVEGQLESRSDLLQQWFWLSVLTQRFDVASSTQAATDFTTLRSGSAPSYSSLKDGVLTVAAGPLLDATRRKAGAFWRGFACALATDFLADPINGETLVDPSSGLLTSRAAIASVFPRSGAIPGRSPVHLLVLGTFIASPASRRQLAENPSAWTTNRLAEDAVRSQLLAPTSELNALLLDSSAFVSDRLERLRAFASDRTATRIVLV